MHQRDPARFLFVLPALLLVLVFVYAFLFWNVRVSLTNWVDLRPDLTWAGLRHYARLLAADPRFRVDLWNNLRFLVLFVGLTTLTGLVLALLLDGRVLGVSLWRSVYLYPLSLSYVVTGTVWAWLFNPTTGLNALLRSLGLGFLASGWVTDPRVALYAVVLAAAWQMSGFAMAIHLAALQAIDPQVYEAAAVDGATGWQRLRHVTLPLLLPATIGTVVVLGHVSLKIFDLVWVMTSGGPGYATDVPAVYMFVAAFRQNRLAYAAAIATLMVVLVGLLLVPYLIYQRREAVRQ